MVIIMRGCMQSVEVHADVHRLKVRMHCIVHKYICSYYYMDV